MFGLIGKMLTTPGDRDKVAELMTAGTGSMPGCLSYVIAKDPTDDDALWITEVWVSRDAHQASLALPEVQEAIAQARPHIAGFGERFETEPVSVIGADA